MDLFHHSITSGVVVNAQSKPNLSEGSAPPAPTSPPGYDNPVYGSQGYPPQAPQAGFQYPPQTGYQSQAGEYFSHPFCSINRLRAPFRNASDD